MTLLHFEVPLLGSAAAEFFQQPTFWDNGPRPDETAFELFGAALNDVVAQKVDSSRYDPPFLRRISAYASVLKRGIDRVLIIDADRRANWAITIGDQVSPGRIDSSVVRAASQLAAVTPSARRVRVAGRLDLMGASQGVLKVEVKPGEVVTALWEGEEGIEHYRELFNRDVVLEGVAVFRPSGALLRIDADRIASASGQDSFFREVPEAPVVRDFEKLARLKQGERSAYLQLRGSIPADEPDADFEAALAALR